MTLILTEKSSQAKALASIMDNVNKSVGKGLIIAYYEGIECLICPLSGHVFETNHEKEGVDLLNFTPPAQILKRVADISTSQKKSIHARLKHIQGEYFPKIDTLLLATDPDPEGCAIAREVIEGYGFDAITDITYMDMSNSSKASLANALIKAMQTKKDHLNWERYAYAAWLRSDFSLTGLAISHTINDIMKKHNSNAFFTYGTQQTRILDLVVGRYFEHKEHDKSDHYRIRIQTPKGEFLLTLDDAINTKDKQGIEALSQRLKDEGRIKINSVKILRELEKSPKWYDGSHIGAKVSKEKKVSTADVYSDKQSVMQNMYENGYITYIRGGAKGKMPLVDLEAYKTIAEHIAKYYHAPKLDTSLIKPYLWRKDDSKEVVRHTPCTIADTFDISKFTGVEKAVLDTASKQILATFYPDAKVINYKIEAQSGGILLHLEDKETVDIGWKEIYNIKPSVLKNNNTRNIEEGEILSIQDVTIETYQIPSPPLFTEASLLEAIKKKGIGTDSTFGSMIDFVLDRQKRNGKVIKREFFTMNSKKQIIPTEKGIVFNSVFPKELKESIKAFESGVFKLLLSGEIDEDKGMIYKNKLSSALYREVTQIFRENVDKFKIFGKEQYAKKEIVNTSVMCPKCQSVIVDTGKTYRCSKGKSVKKPDGKWENTGCDFMLYKYHTSGLKYTITEEILQKLIEEGIAKDVKISREKSGSVVEGARLKLTDDYKTVEVIQI